MINFTVGPVQMEEEIREIRRRRDTVFPHAGILRTDEGK